MPGSLTTPGRPALAMTRSDVLPSTICTVSAPKIGLFRGSMAGLCAPLSTLRRGPRGPLRMTRGPMWIAIPSSRRTCTSYSLPVLTGAPKLKIFAPQIGG